MKKIQLLRRIRFARKKVRTQFGRRGFAPSNVIMKRNFQSKRYRTLYCKRTQCDERNCKFAHDESELRNEDYKYESDPKYKEYQCNQINCSRPRCKYYHDISEKRINILQKKINDLKNKVLKQPKFTQNNKKNQTENSKQDSGIIKKKKLNISSLVPSLIYFDEENLNQLFNQILKIVSIMNESENESFLPIQNLIQNEKKQNQIAVQDKSKQNIQNCINNVIINLVQRRSTINKNYNYALLNLLNKIPILSFQYKLFKYERNYLKGQSSYFIKTNDVIPFVCSDIKQSNPRSLRLDIRSLNHDWKSFVELMETVSSNPKSIHKIDLNLQEFIGPKDIKDLEKIFNKTITTLSELKAINIRLKFDYLEDGGYERDVVDVFLELFRKLLQENPKLNFSLNIFRIVIKYKQNNLEIFSEKTDRNKEHKIKVVNQMFKNSKLHQYFLTKFAEIFRINSLKFFKLDFSNLFLTQKRQEQVPRHQYEREIECLIVGITSIVNNLRNNCLEKLSMEFFGFTFQFEEQPQKKMLAYQFQLGFQLFFQNTPIVTIRCFTPFSELINRKLKKNYIYSSFEGNLFTSKFYRKKGKKKPLEQSEHMQKIEAKQKFIKLTTDKAYEFLNLVTDRFERVRKIKYFQGDSYHLNKILLRQRQRLTHTIIIDPKSYNRNLEISKMKVVKINQFLDFQRRQFLYFYAKLKKIQKRNKNFTLRIEVLQEIQRLIKLQLDLYIPQYDR